MDPSIRTPEPAEITALAGPSLEAQREPATKDNSYPLLSEHGFATALQCERRRTERSQRPFLLALADVGRLDGNGHGGAKGRALAVALASSARETDRVGWYIAHQVVGMIFTELGQSERDVILNNIKSRLKAVIEGNLTGDQAKKVSLQFHFFPESSDLPRGNPENHNGHPELYQPVRHSVTPHIKRAIDVAGSGLALIVLSPLLALIWALVKLTSPGAALYRQKRFGQYGKEFVFLKFRSMYQNSDCNVHKEYVADFVGGKAQMHDSPDGKGKVYKLANDPRITPLGRILRKTSLDELPQFINVFRGDMSLVGPRPPVPYEFEHYDIWHRRRIMEIKPGITGLWQVCGRSRTTFDEMVRLDLQYARRWSLLLDFMILLKTPLAVLSGDGAY